MENKRKFIGKEKLTLRRKLERNYKIISFLNNFMIGFEFLAGSIEFLPGNSYIIGVYLFIIGSAQILVAQIIIIARDIHMKDRKME